MFFKVELSSTVILISVMMKRNDLGYKLENKGGIIEEYLVQPVLHLFSFQK